MDLALYLRQLEELVNIDSGSGNISGIRKVADRLSEWYRELGWGVNRIGLGEERFVLLITNRPAENYDVLYVGHMDTVFPKGTVSQRPFRIADGNCYGPGVGDMKNGDVAMYHIARGLPPSVSERLNIAMVYNPDEEIGSVYSSITLDEIASRAKIIFVMESAAGRGETHCFARKGSLSYDIDFHGLAAHAGYMFEIENASAVLEMANTVVRLMALANREQGTSVNVGTACGGTARNVVPDFASLKVEMRYKNSSERERVKSAVMEILKGEPFVNGVRREVTYMKESAPLAKRLETIEFIARLKEVAASLGIPFDEKDRGGLSDANHMAEHTDAVIADGMGPHGDFDHSEKEYCMIDSIEPCIRFHIGFLAEVAADRS